MSAPIALSATEHGRVRVFSLSMSEAEAESLDLTRALGQAPGDPAQVEIFPVSNLDGLGLAGYLVDGCGIPEVQIAPDRARLDALDGHVMLLFSRAYEGASVTLTPAPALTLIGTYDEDRPDTTAAPLESESARSYTGAPRRSSRSPRENRAASRRAGMIFFTVVILLVILVLILVL